MTVRSKEGTTMVRLRVETFAALVLVKQAIEKSSGQHCSTDDAVMTAVEIALAGKP